MDWRTSDKLNLVAGQVSRPVPPEEPGGEPFLAGASCLAPVGPKGTGDELELGPAGAIAGWLEGGRAILDATGRITEINESLSGWLGQPASALVRGSFWNLLAENCREWKEALDALCQGTDTFAEIKLRLPSATSPSAPWFSLEL